VGNIEIDAAIVALEKFMNSYALSSSMSYPKVVNHTRANLSLGAQLHRMNAEL
jgi:hypothetical protein